MSSQDNGPSSVGLANLPSSGQTSSAETQAMGLPAEDSIMPIPLQPPPQSRVLPARERAEHRVATRDAVQEEPAPARGGKLPLVLGGIAALVLMALPLPMLLDGTVSLGPRMGLLVLFAVPPVVFMLVVQGRYGGRSKS